ncbi:alpha/beta hydrolase [soil metagenome]
MKKVLLTVFVVLLTILLSAIVFILAASYPVPEGAEEIMEEVFASELPNQILGDTGYAVSNGVNIWYENISPAGVPKGTILLIMGLGGNALEWPLFFTRPLVEAGYQVIRFDNRSSGLSTWPEEDFSLNNMAEDAMAVMDALEIEKAHILGMSMGGMIGQIMAIEYPERVETLISFMSSGHTDDPELPTVSRATYLSIMATGIRHGIHRTEKNIVRTTVSVRSVLSPDLSEQRIRALAEQSLYNQRYRKGFNTKAFIQHTRAIRNAGPRYEGLKNLETPTLVIHGKEDPLIPVEHGIKTAQVIPNAELLLLEGMGHDVSSEHAPLIHDVILNFLNQ